MAGKTRRCEECKEDISQRGRAAKRCKRCDKLIRQQRSIEHQERRAEQMAHSGVPVVMRRFHGRRHRGVHRRDSCGVHPASRLRFILRLFLPTLHLDKSGVPIIDWY